MHNAAQQGPSGGGGAGAIAICVGASKIEPVSASLSPAGSRASTSARRGALLPALASLALVLIPLCARAAAQEPVAAVWKERQLHFSYRSFMAVHPCHVLQNRIERVLNALGARPDVKVTLANCAPFASPVVADDGAAWPQIPPGSSPGDWPTARYGDNPSQPRNPIESGLGTYKRSEPRQVVDVQVRLSIPAEMTPEIIAELKVDRRRREMIARVSGDPLPLFDDPIAFAAQRKVVTLSHETTGIEPADCELLQQMASSVFKTLGVREVRRGFICDRMSASHIYPTLDAVALVPVTNRLADGVATPADDQPGPPVPEGPREAPASSDADQKPE